MANRMPSLMALLGLLAVAGYQNRDKIGELLKKLPAPAQRAPDRSGSDQPASGDLLSEIGGMFGSGGAGGTVANGLGELIERFRQAGKGNLADSWVSSGHNQVPDSRDVEEAIGPELIGELTRRLGLSREEVLARLAANIPTAVDDMTPQGRLPTADEARGFV